MQSDGESGWGRPIDYSRIHDRMAFLKKTRLYDITEGDPYETEIDGVTRTVEVYTLRRPRDICLGVVTIISGDTPGDGKAFYRESEYTRQELAPADPRLRTRLNELLWSLTGDKPEALKKYG
jgi:hypothetical protein